MTNEEILLRALQRTIERWKRRKIETEEASHEVKRIVFSTLFAVQPKKEPEQ